MDLGAWSPTSKPSFETWSPKPKPGFEAYGPKSEPSFSHLFLIQLNLRTSASFFSPDPPGAQGCTSCLVNDLDLSVKTARGTEHPNGRTDIDTKNTVERVRIPTPDEGEEVRIIVHARNFGEDGQRYSLAVTGCFSEESPAAAAPVPAPVAAAKPDSASRNDSASSQNEPSCPMDGLFELTLNTADDGAQLSWNLIASVPGNNGVDHVASGPADHRSGYEDDSRYVESACLDSGKRYRFQLRNKTGDVIRGQYKLTYGGTVVFDSQSSGGRLGRVSTFRFKTTDSGSYQTLGSNAFSPHMQSGDEAVISTIEAGDVEVLSSAYDDSNDGGDGIMLTQHTEEELRQHITWTSEYIATSEDIEEVGDVKEATPAEEEVVGRSNDIVLLPDASMDDHIEEESPAVEHLPIEEEDIGRGDFELHSDVEVHVEDVVVQDGYEGYAKVGEVKMAEDPYDEDLDGDGLIDIYPGYDEVEEGTAFDLMSPGEEYRQDEFELRQQEFEDVEFTDSQDDDHEEALGEAIERAPIDAAERDREGAEEPREERATTRVVETGEGYEEVGEGMVFDLVSPGEEFDRDDFDLQQQEFEDYDTEVEFIDSEDDDHEEALGEAIERAPIHAADREGAEAPREEREIRDIETGEAIEDREEAEGEAFERAPPDAVDLRREDLGVRPREGAPREAGEPASSPHPDDSGNDEGESV